MKKMSQILVPLTAGNPEGLSRKMFDNNIKNSRWFNYTTPTYQNNIWICWYEKDIEDEVNENVLPMRKS